MSDEVQKQILISAEEATRQLVSQITHAKESLPPTKQLLDIDTISSYFGDRDSAGKRSLSQGQILEFEKKYYLLQPNILDTSTFIEYLQNMEDNNSN